MEKPDARLLLTRPADPELGTRLLDENPGLELVPVEKPVIEMYREAWVTGLTSYNEAFGLVLVESMACGTPVFAAKEGGPAETVNGPEVGTLFEGDDERDVARAILEGMELATAPGTAAACRARAQDFSTMASAEATLGVYREVLSR
jgi:D-inositol-3-phosphate glycosyltransferase